ncbi:PDZ domain-containing protein [Streptomyces sp. NPDC005474]|uniref:PDZ domain-containing protein n=1 Tax=Streptomyces sp. NPDC005474 TaxID=3154878 RepID=UPI003455788D
MEQTALRPKPMPGREPADGTPPRQVRRPHAARRRGRRLMTLLFGLSVGAVLVLAGVGLGTLGVTTVGLNKLAELHRQTGQGGRTGQPGVRAGAPAPTASPPGAPSPPASPSAVTATLGLEAVDAEKAGALLVGVHVPGPGYTAGLVRGDVLLACGGTRIDSAADLARVVGHARPGAEITLTVVHRSGGHQQLIAVPGVVT